MSCALNFTSRMKYLGNIDTLSAKTATADAAVDRSWCNTDIGRVWAVNKADSTAYEATIPSTPQNGYGASSYFSYGNKTAPSGVGQTKYNGQSWVLHAPPTTRSEVGGARMHAPQIQ